MVSIVNDHSVTLKAIPNIPLIKEGDDLGEIIVNCAEHAGISFEPKDILIIASKIISKAEGRLVSLHKIKPSPRAQEIADISGKDARIVELMMQEAEILRVAPKVVETMHRLGFVCTSAGIDRGNTARPEEEKVSLLPLDPDKSAQKISDTIFSLTKIRLGIVVNDSLGAKGRVGSIGMAIGLAELPALKKGSTNETDLYGKKRNVLISLADEIAAAGSLLMGQSANALPVIILRGLQYPDETGKFNDLLTQ